MIYNNTNRFLVYGMSVLCSVLFLSTLSLPPLPSLGNLGADTGIYQTTLVYADALPPGDPSNTGTNKTLPPGTNSSGVSGDGKVSFKNPLKYNSVELLLTALTQWAIRIGTLIAIFFFILAGFNYVTALGDEAKLKNAKRSLMNAAIGTAILVGANVIMSIIRNTLESIQAK